jgi:phosphate transport system substrate-binding protein
MIHQCPHEASSMRHALSPLRRTLFGLLAGFALIAPASAADQPMTEVLRDRLHIVSSGSSQAVAKALTDVFNTRYAESLSPRLDLTGSGVAFDRFCVGIGPSTPDIALTSRRMPPSVAANCRANGVADIIEVRLGLSALVLAVRRGDPLTGLTLRQVYRALAADLPGAEDFERNGHATWSQIQPALPALPIAAILSARGSGTRSLFDDFVMEGGCRYEPSVQRIFSASFRVGRCVTLRGDGRIRELPSGQVPGALLDAPPGTIATISYEQVLESGGNLVALSLEGVMPSAASISSLEYPVTRTVYLYAKRQHARATMGVGVVRGVREFVNDAVSEPIAGPGGILARSGLVPLAPHLRLVQQRIAQRETLYSR